MNLWLFLSLAAASGLMMLLEMRGVPVVQQLPFKGDIKRESQFLAQFGQAVATVIVMALIYSFEHTPAGGRKAMAVLAAVFGTSAACFVIKRLTGRVRPNRENAGKFLGPSLKHANWRESFPSSHSACAIALSVALTTLYPQAAIVFWTLGLITAILRYLMDAHWPSDVLAGIALGYAIAYSIMLGFGYTQHWLS
ncbi:MAG: phosphatase PAP2 family protein [Tepidisphaeraceae bacterium]